MVIFDSISLLPMIVNLSWLAVGIAWIEVVILDAFGKSGLLLSRISTEQEGMDSLPLLLGYAQTPLY